MKNKKGLSQIVTTVIIILLVIVAIALVWQIVKGLLSSKGTDIQNKGKCMDIDLQVAKVIPTNKSGSMENYTLTVKRNAGGDGTPVTVKVTFYNSTTNSNLTDFGVLTEPGSVMTKQISVNVTDATKVGINSYIVDDSGKSLFCQETTKEF